MAVKLSWQLRFHGSQAVWAVKLSWQLSCHGSQAVTAVKLLWKLSCHVSQQTSCQAVNHIYGTNLYSFIFCHTHTLELDKQQNEINLQTELSKWNIEHRRFSVQINYFLALLGRGCSAAVVQNLASASQVWSALQWSSRRHSAVTHLLVSHPVSHLLPCPHWVSSIHS